MGSYRSVDITRDEIRKLDYDLFSLAFLKRLHCVPGNLSMLHKVYVYWERNESHNDKRVKELMDRREATSGDLKVQKRSHQLVIKVTAYSI